MSGRAVYSFDLEARERSRPAKVCLVTLGPSGKVKERVGKEEANVYVEKAKKRGSKFEAKAYAHAPLYVDCQRPSHDVRGASCCRGHACVLVLGLRVHACLKSENPKWLD